MEVIQATQIKSRIQQISLIKRQSKWQHQWSCEAAILTTGQSTNVSQSQHQTRRNDHKNRITSTQQMRAAAITAHRNEAPPAALTARVNR